MNNLKNLILLMCCVCLVAACGQKIDARQLKKVNGLAYKIGDSDPFSGTVMNVSVYEFVRAGENGSCTVSMNRGVLDGKVTCTTEKGDKLYEATWHGENRDGAEKLWNSATGHLVTAREWKDGRKNGVEQEFNSQINKLVYEAHWADDKKSGQEKRWDQKGEALLVDLTWKDGKQTGTSKIGDWEETYVDGEFDGIRRRYAIKESTPNQQNVYVALEENWKIGKREGIRKSWHENGSLSSEEQYKAGNRISLREWNDKGVLRRESYFEPDNRDLPTSWGGEAARRTYDASGRLVDSLCFNNDCSGLDRIFSSKSQPPNTTIAPIASADSVSPTGKVGQCVSPRTKVAKNGNLEFERPIKLQSSPGSTEGETLKVIASFRVKAEIGTLIQIAEPESGKAIGWVRFADFEFQDLRNCNL